MNDNRTEIIGLLRSTKRHGIDKVIEWLDSAHSFFEASAARIHHDNVKGGLASHSLRVFQLAKADWDSRDESFKRKYPLESVIIAALLHDVCKKDVYYIDADGIPQWNDVRKNQYYLPYRPAQRSRLARLGGLRLWCVRTQTHTCGGAFQACP